MIAADSVCHTVYTDEWGRIQAEGEIVKNGLRSAASFIRLGDGELNVLRRQNYLSERLRAAVAEAGILGLPDAYNRRPHPWRAALLKEMPPSDAQVVSAVPPLCLRSLIG